jgi:hypothetical protein
MAVASKSANETQKIIDALNGMSNQTINSIHAVNVLQADAKKIILEIPEYKSGKVNKVKTQVIEIDQEMGKNSVLPARAVIAMMLNGTILPYENNRGAGSIKSTAKKVHKKYEPTGISGVAFCYQDGQYLLSDSHHRVIGFLKRCVDGDVKEKELSHDWCVNIGKPNHHLEHYAILNDCFSHTTREKTSNVDLFYGAANELIVSGLPDEVQAFYRSSTFWHNALQSFVYGIIYPPKGETIEDMSWPDVYVLRGPAKTKSNTPANNHRPLEEEECESIQEGMQFFYDVVHSADYRVTDERMDRKIKTSPVLLGILLHSKINPRQFLDFKISKSPNILAKNITRKASPLVDLVHEATHGGKARITRFFFAIGKKLRGK